jgi:hypothetical protein
MERVCFSGKLLQGDDMRTYLLVKPESTHLLTQLREVLVDQEKNYLQAGEKEKAHFCDVVGRGLDVAKGSGQSLSKEGLAFVRAGVMSDELFDKVYPSPPEGEKGKRFREHLVGNAYFMVGVDLPEWQEDSGHGLAMEIKGKYATHERPEGVGLRGAMKEVYKKLGSFLPSEMENFVHMPDTDAEAAGVFDYLKESAMKEEGLMIFDNEEGTRSGTKEW